MRYPTLTRTATEKLLAQLIEGEKPVVSSEASWAGSGEDIDLTALSEAVSEIRAAYDDYWADDDAISEEDFEGRASGLLHHAFKSLPTEVLDDPGFWRYVSLDMYWWFVAKREAAPISSGNGMKYVNGDRHTECVPLRMFLRAQSIERDEDYELASSMPRATDFWRSHVIRVQTGSAPQLARAFARLQSEVSMSTNELRSFARQVNRLWKNIAFHRLDEDECMSILKELFDRERGIA